VRSDPLTGRLAESALLKLAVFELSSELKPRKYQPPGQVVSL